MKRLIAIPRLFHAGLLCLALPACAPTDFSGMRPEIAAPLSQAKLQWLRHHDAAAVQSIRAAEAVPNQTAAEKATIARISGSIGGGYSTVGNDPSQNYLPPNYSPNPPDQTPNVPHPY